MIQIKVEEIVGQLDTQVQASLRDAVKEVMPDAKFDEHELFHAFKRAIGRRCRRWERIPDRFIDFD